MEIIRENLIMDFPSLENQTILPLPLKDGMRTSARLEVAKSTRQTWKAVDIKLRTNPLAFSAIIERKPFAPDYARLPWLSFSAALSRSYANSERKVFCLMDSKQSDQSIQIARLFTNLNSLRSLIRNEINPLCFHLAEEETTELTQSLELAAAAVDEHLKKYRIQVVGGRNE